MDSTIITKFTIATEQGIEALLYLTQTIARQKFSGLLSSEQLDNYLEQYCSEKALMVEVNSMSNQWLVVYANNLPAGFARVTSKGERPENIRQKRVIRIADFGILQNYTDMAIRQSLFDKCMSVCQPYEAIWINEYVQNPLIVFFKAAGFMIQEGNFKMDEIALPSVYLIK